MNDNLHNLLIGHGKGFGVDNNMCLRKDMPVNIYSRTYLPHWEQEGVLTFITTRLFDSLPQSKLDELSHIKNIWIANHQSAWTEQDFIDYEELIVTKINKWLDANYGECLLYHGESIEIMRHALEYHDGTKYDLYDYVIMPNHIHYVILPKIGHSLSEITHSIKSYSASAINKALGRKGPVWQKESFDHLIRNIEEFSRISEYIKHNPDMLMR